MVSTLIQTYTLNKIASNEVSQSQKQTLRSTITTIRKELQYQSLEVSTISSAPVDLIQQRKRTSKSI